jgi:hypothetical protein
MRRRRERTMAMRLTPAAARAANRAQKGQRAVERGDSGELEDARPEREGDLGHSQNLRPNQRHQDRGGREAGELADEQNGAEVESAGC